MNFKTKIEYLFLVDVLFCSFVPFGCFITLVLLQNMLCQKFYMGKTNHIYKVWVWGEYTVIQTCFRQQHHSPGHQFQEPQHDWVNLFCDWRSATKGQTQSF